MLVGASGTAVWKMTWGFLKKQEVEFPYDPATSLLNGNPNSCNPNAGSAPYVHCSINHGRQNTETLKVSIKGWRHPAGHYSVFKRMTFHHWWQHGWVQKTHAQCCKPSTKHCTMSLVCGLCSVDLIEAESRTVVPRARGRVVRMRKGHVCQKAHTSVWREEYSLGICYTYTAWWLQLIIILNCKMASRVDFQCSLKPET